MSAAREHRIQVQRSARYYTLGNPDSARELWLVCHGYGQLAGRFIANFADIASAERLVVAPEAPLRFYLDPIDRPAAQRRVGASWMTREDRANDISDYIELLDQVVLAASGRTLPVVALGFSQGVATVARWAIATAHPVARLLLWGSLLPPDLDPEGALKLRAIPVQLIMGDTDEFASPAQVAQQETRAKERGIRMELVTYTGGHSIDRATLLRLAAPARTNG